ncbi:helix-turn-helix domain-containing protein [Streptomyces griseorubiginosus]|uniref:helix-turn-helix domain-containing protein n=1 Tax=Streptomyces griseorubiginosus TaxID=67304 RepID=UPI0036EA1388
MSDQGAGRRIAPLPTGLSPARAAFAAELRRYLARSGTSQRNLAVRADQSPSTLSRIFSGARLPTPQGLRQLCEGLGLNAEEHQRMYELLIQAMEQEPSPVGQVDALRARLAEAEEELQRAREAEVHLQNLLAEYERRADRYSREDGSLGRPQLPPAGMSGSHPTLASVLATLRQEAGLALQRTADLLAATGVTASEANVDRALREPATAPRLSFHIAQVLIEQLPHSRRGAVRNELFRALLAVDAAGSDMLDEHVPSELDHVSALAFSPDGAMLATVDDYGTVRLWDPMSHEPLGSPFTDHENYVQAMAFSPDGTLLATGDTSGTVRLWDPVTLEPLGSPLTGHQGGVAAVVVSPNGNVLAARDSGGTVRLWNLATGELLGTPLTSPRDALLDTAFSPDSTVLATRDTRGNVQLWDLTADEPVRTAAFRPDGTPLDIRDAGARAELTHDSDPGKLVPSRGKDPRQASASRPPHGSTHRPARRSGGWRSGRERPGTSTVQISGSFNQVVSGASGADVTQAVSRSSDGAEVRAALDSVRDAAMTIDSTEDRSVGLLAADRIESALASPGQSRAAIEGAVETIVVLGRIHPALAGPAVAVQQAVQPLL